MRQQINLYQSVFRPQSTPFSAAMGLGLLAVFVFVLVAVFAQQSMTGRARQTELVSLEKDTGRLLDELESISGELSGSGASKLLEAEVTRLQRELDERKAMEAALANYSLNTRRSFSTVLESLARRHVEGTWLTAISISDGGDALGLAGNSFASELVPAYLKNLSRESVLAGLSFNVLELSRSEENPAYLNFLVRSKAEPFP